MNAEVIQKHPYEIAKANKIIVVVAEPLGKINGYYNRAFGQRFIHVNDKLPEHRQHHVVNHILRKALKNQDGTYLLMDSGKSYTILHKESEAH